MAQARPDGTGTTYAATTDLSNEESHAGIKSHTTFDAAKAEISKMAVAAEKLGWHDQRKGFTARPDAFSPLPAAKMQRPKAK